MASPESFSKGTPRPLLGESPEQMANRLSEGLELAPQEDTNRVQSSSGKEIDHGREAQRQELLRKYSPKLITFFNRWIKNFQLVSMMANTRGTYLYIPSGGIEPEDLTVFDDPTMVLDSPDGNYVPTYNGLDTANLGRNTDGSEHGGYFVYDTTNGRVVNIVDRHGNPK